MNITPTCGRKIWLHLGTADKGLNYMGAPVADYDREREMDASVAYVNADGTINVGFLDHAGVPHHRGNVPIVNPAEVGHRQEMTYAYWMPYQMGQAAKTETLEAQVRAYQTTPADDSAGSASSGPTTDTMGGAA